MNIRVNLNTNIADGSEVVFRSPADCSQVTGLVIYHTGGKTEFAFADAHGNNVGDIDHLFAENAVVKVILDVTAGMAFVQNADTNAYIERTFVKSVNGINPDSDGNVEREVGGKGSGIYIGSGDMPEGCNAQIDLDGKILDLASLMTEDEVERSIEDALEDFEPPKSGGGIEVSGAKVGQFLKVAEVDENGVPTAWETAEMPKKTWKTVQDTVLTEDVNEISLTDINAKEVYMHIYAHINNQDNSLPNANASANVLVNDSSRLALSIPIGHVRSSAKFSVILHFKAENGILSLYRILHSGTSAGNVMTGDYLVYGNKFNNISVMLSNTSHMFKANSTVRIYVVEKEEEEA